jgi:hypothetical protein
MARTDDGAGMSGGLGIPFDRVTYRDGQLLAARSLGDDRRDEARRRWLHVRHLHDTWGIAMGLTVHADQAGTAVVLGPGYAVDDGGRDLVLANGLHLPVPDIPGPTRFVLTLRYLDDEAFQPAPGLVAVCPGGGLGVRRERPLITWRAPDDVRFGPEVPVVQVTASGGVIQGPLDFRVRRHARPFVRPHLRWGVTDGGRTGWRVWKAGEQKLGLEVEVDTADAGFLRAPYYFAALTGDVGPTVDGTPLTAPAAWPAKTSVAFGLGGPGFLAKAEVARFVYRIPTVGGLPFTQEITPVQAEARGWVIVWLGAEPAGGCEPELDLSKIFSQGGFIKQVILAILGGG